MKHLSYRTIQTKAHQKSDEELFVEEVAISQIASAVGTPFYCYSKKSLVENFQSFVDAFEAQKITDYKICYAIKANFNLSLVKILSELGSGIDAVSAGEIFRALKAGVNPKKIVFAGVGKTRDEMKFALENGVEEFSVESIAEMFLLNEVACSLDKKAKFSLRVNPNVDAKTHDKISTGRKGDKFGVDIELAKEVYAKAARLSGLEIYGISMHIGSQITTIEPFEKAFEKMRQLFLELKSEGHKISALDFGGGIGIFYKNENTLLLSDYAKLIKKITHDLDVKITIAPGRAMIGNAGLLATKIIFLKETSVKDFVIIDAAMNDLMRPGLYGSYHEVLQNVRKDRFSQVSFEVSDKVFDKFSDKVSTKVSEKVFAKVFDLAGPVCESTDILAQSRILIEPKPEDLLVFCSAGAYGSSMSNEYNCRPMIPEILVDGKNFSVIRRRPSFEEMLNLY